MSSGQAWAAERDEEERVAAYVKRLEEIPPKTNYDSRIASLVLGAIGDAPGRFRCLERLLKEHEQKVKAEMAQKLSVRLMQVFR